MMGRTCVDCGTRYKGEDGDGFCPECIQRMDANVIKYGYGPTPNPWRKSSEVEPPKDGTRILAHWEGLPEDDGAYLPHAVAYVQNYASHDLGVDGVWSAGLLSNTDRDPDYWMPIPEPPKCHIPDATKMIDEETP